MTIWPNSSLAEFGACWPNSAHMCSAMAQIWPTSGECWSCPGRGPGVPPWPAGSTTMAPMSVAPPASRPWPQYPGRGTAGGSRPWPRCPGFGPAGVNIHSSSAPLCHPKGSRGSVCSANLGATAETQARPKLRCGRYVVFLSETARPILEVLSRSAASMLFGYRPKSNRFRGEHAQCWPTPAWTLTTLGNCC